jgi:5-hydroxyisourate hydrolase
VAEHPPTISTHVLDTALGAPRPGVRVRLWRAAGAAGGRLDLVGDALTDADGRISDLLAGAPLEAGTYRIEFSLGDGFFAGLAADVRIDDATRSHHVPLLLAPFGLTTYRGS